MRLALTGQLTKEVQLGRETLAADVFVSLGWDDERKFKKPPLALTTLKIPVGKIWDRFIEPKPNLQIISARMRDSRTRARSIRPVAKN